MRAPGRWLTWLVGAAMLAVVVAAVVHFAEARAFVGLVERSQPSWLAVAVLLQILTYVAQGEVFLAAPHASGHAVPRRLVYELSLTKLFLDQAVPSAGLASTAIVANALERQGIPRALTAAGAILNIASYHLSYVLLLLGALGVVFALGAMNALVAAISLLFIAFAVAFAGLVLGLAGRASTGAGPTARIPGLKGIATFLAAADTRLARHPGLLLKTGGWQAAIFLLDAFTMWSLIHAVGAAAPATAVFAAFMVASVFRTVSVSPGGLGAYEAASVLTLKMVGVSLPVALATTLLFRGLSFWAPMLPGLWCSRRLLREKRPEQAEPATPEYWSIPGELVAAQLQSGPDGLPAREAAARLVRYGPNALEASRSRTWLHVLANQLRSPLLLLLVFAALASGLTQEWFDASMVLVIVITTVVIGFAREYSAETAAQALRARVRVRARAVRDGRLDEVDAVAIVPGDVVELAAGSLVPGDGVLLSATDFFVSESALTGESFPVEKRPGVVPASAALPERTNCLFFGTNVRSGTARCLIVHTGAGTEFGAIAGALARRAPEAEFDRGLRRFGYLLTVAMLVLVILVFAAHMLRGRPAVETLLFSIALAVGLSPELLPAILSINLARGARMLARQGVLVRRLNAIENLGSMDVLCTDKTGTLTEGVVRVQDAFDPVGVPAPAVLELAAYNAALETGVSSPLDDAILDAHRPDLSGLAKCGEIPFDFARRRVTVVTTVSGGAPMMITKGAFHHVLEACSRDTDGRLLDGAARAALGEKYESWSRDGIRVLAVATREIAVQPAYSRDDERDMIFRGFVTFLDRPKAGVADALTSLAALGVSFKLITGDNGLVARHVAGLVGLRCERVVTGHELNTLHGGALWHAVEQADVFAEVDPGQKERIIAALKRAGHVVGFLGDGINDAPAMHAADTSLSVEKAVDVAREAADFVLLEQGLDVIRRGVEEGRRTFANTIKYVLITTSANLGNMVSMAAASIVLPFLPLLAGQILLNNLLSDIPAVGLADDGIDAEMVARPERWDIRFIGRFMVVFGLISSLFDVITFVTLRLAFHAAPELFRTTWFVESLLTELVVALVVRTRRPFFRSRPGRLLLTTTTGVGAVALALPFVPGVSALGFVPPPAPILASVILIAAAYVAATELGKSWFFRRASG